MIRLVLFIYFILFSFTIFAQSKPKQKESIPSKKELNNMMQEMQKSITDISPDYKKMMDSMGIKLPDLKSIQKNVSGVSHAQMEKALENENRIVPRKDLVRINAALTVTISNTEMGIYITKTHLSVLSKLPANDKTIAAEIFQQIIKLKSSLANSAVGLWMDGKPTLALYLMGEACKADPANTINLNNYASFLTMCGAEQKALPILNNLNRRYPKNSSILNNISQAWLGLGEITKAEKYVDSTIHIYAYHPQANMAKCLIEESKGNIPAAIAAAKNAISKSYSSEKENKLKKLGYKLKSDDINWNRPMPQDALGLSKFTWPEYPLDVEQNKLLVKEWNDFTNECQQKISELNIKQQSLEEAWLAANEYRSKSLISEAQKGHNVQLMPGYAAKAIKKLGPGVNDINGNMSFVFANELQRVSKAILAVGDYENLLSEKQKEFDKKYEDKVGEGKANPLEEMCKDENNMRSEFLASANGGLQSAYRNYFAYSKRRTSDLLYYYQYTMWPEEFELAKVIAQITWLTQIKDQRVFFKDKSSWCVPIVLKPKKGNDSLQNFDDVHCDYVSTLNLGVYKIISSCSNLVGEFDFGGVKINMKDNVETGRYSGSAMVGTSKSFEGPAGAEVEASVAALVEWDNTGITDVGAIAGVEAKAGGITAAGADVKVTINSGVSTSGKGILEGLN
jgi:hypothetical protein